MSELAVRTAEATRSAEATLSEINDGSDRAAASIDVIAAAIAGVTDLQTSIATAVEEQSLRQPALDARRLTRHRQRSR